MTNYVHFHYYGDNQHALVFHDEYSEFVCAVRISQENANKLVENGANHGS